MPGMTVFHDAFDIQLKIIYPKAERQQKAIKLKQIFSAWYSGDSIKEDKNDVLLLCDRGSDGKPDGQRGEVSGGTDQKRL